MDDSLLLLSQHRVRIWTKFGRCILSDACMHTYINLAGLDAGPGPQSWLHVQLTDKALCAPDEAAPTHRTVPGYEFWGWCPLLAILLG